MSNEATYFPVTESITGRSFDTNDALPGDLGLGDVFDGVLSARRQEGYEAGYRRAVNDLLADFVLISEQFLRRQEAPPAEVRKILRAFEDHLERSIGTTPMKHFVDGGLGI